MEKKYFDRIIKEKLERLEVEYDPMSWELLEQKLDTEGVGTPVAEEKVVDTILFEKLHQLEVPYQAESWELMSSRLDEEYSFTGRIYRYKAMELAIMLLILITLVQYLPVSNRANNAGTPLATFEQTPSYHNDPAGIEIQESLIGQSEAAASGLSDEETAPAAISEAAPPLSSSGKDAASAKSNIIAQTNNNPEQDGVEKAGFTLTQSNKYRILQPLSSIVKELQLMAESLDFLGQVLFVNQTSISGFDNENIALLAPINKLYPHLLDYGANERESFIIKPARKKNYLRVGMVSSFDYNRIITPPNKADGLDGFARFALGYGGGITIGIEIKRWEIETGFIYSAKQYKPLQVLYVEGSLKDGYYGKGLKDIQLNMLILPLNVRYNFIWRNKWRVYALTGFSLQVAYQANYYLADLEGFRGPSFAPGPPPEGEPANLPTKIDEKNFSGGWFEGGTFKENSYITGNLGLGVERYFSSRLSLFAQPTYQYSINQFIQGLGPDQDRINTLSILTGVKVRLQRK